MLFESLLELDGGGCLSDTRGTDSDDALETSSSGLGRFLSSSPVKYSSSELELFDVLATGFCRLNVSR